MERALDQFCEQGVMMRDGDNFLSLALPETKGRETEARATVSPGADGAIAGLVPVVVDRGGRTLTITMPLVRLLDESDP